MEKKKKKSATGILFCGFCDHKCSVTIFLLESRPPLLTMASLCCSFPRGVRRTSHQARRRGGLCGASGSRKGRSASSRTRLRKNQSGAKVQVGPDGAAHFVTPTSPRAAESFSICLIKRTFLFAQVKLLLTSSSHFMSSPNQLTQGYNIQSSNLT